MRLRTELGTRLCELSEGADAQDVGWCHNDLVLANIRCRADGAIVFFDFGEAEVGPRANELVRLRASLRKRVETGRFHALWDAFLDGYAGVRTVPALATDSEYLLIVEALRRIGWIGGVMASCPLRMGTETFNREWVRAQLESVRECVAQIAGGQHAEPGGEHVE